MAPAAGTPASGATAPVPVVFDTDMDFDDAAALAYQSQEHNMGRIQLRAVTVTNSGVGLPGFAIRNARCLLTRFGLGHVPVADGSPTAPNVAPPEARLTVELVMTSVLLGCLEGTHPASVSAAQLLVHSVRSAPADVVLLTTGPLSNVATALRLDAALADDLAGTYVMGGAVRVPGNLCCTTTAGTDGSQELNMWIDPPAARDTFASLPDHSVSLIPLEATRFVPLTTAFAQRLNADQRTPEAKLVAAIANHPVVAAGAAVASGVLVGPAGGDGRHAARRRGLPGGQDRRRPGRPTGGPDRAVAGRSGDARRRPGRPGPLRADVHRHPQRPVALTEGRRRRHNGIGAMNVRTIRREARDG